MLANYGIRLNYEDIKVEFNAQRDQGRVMYVYHRPANLIVFRAPFAFEILVNREARKAGGIIGSVQRSLDNARTSSEQEVLNEVKKSVHGD
jgi:hypothetical protein